MKNRRLFRQAVQRTVAFPTSGGWRQIFLILADMVRIKLIIYSRYIEFMRVLATKYYRPTAINDFLVFSDGNILSRNKFLIVHDKDSGDLRKKKIKFHVESDDYFGTLATVIDLIREEKEKTEGRQNGILKKLRDDLIYLQENYKIVRKK